jgi:hypothetical protein
MDASRERLSSDISSEKTEDRSEDIWETTDMSLAAWMRAKGKKIISLARTEPRRKEFRFVFQDKKHECGQLALDYLNSDAHAYDTALRALKKMCFGPNGMKSAMSRRR